MDEADKALEKFNAAMADDLNTADAIGALFELVREIFKLPQSGVSPQALQKAEQTMLQMTDILGLLHEADRRDHPRDRRRCSRSARGAQG